MRRAGISAQGGKPLRLSHALEIPIEVGFHAITLARKVKLGGAAPVAH
jgi:hypothetical protein